LEFRKFKLMNNNPFYLLVAISVITHIIRTIYEILKHKKILKSNRLTFVIIFFNMVLLWFSWFGLCSIDIIRITIPDVIRYLGIFLALSGVVLFLTALFTIKTLEDYSGDLITKGIYYKIRHPMYLVFYGGIFSSILSISFIGNILFWRYLEEKELEKRFSEYKFYRVKTYF
jgi:protein-S-isoprenylcysteine O-methyltransferase Ste14